MTAVFSLGVAAGGSAAEAACLANIAGPLRSEKARNVALTVSDFQSGFNALGDFLQRAPRDVDLVTFWSVKDCIPLGAGPLRVQFHLPVSQSFQLEPVQGEDFAALRLTCCFSHRLVGRSDNQGIFVHSDPECKLQHDARVL